MEDMEFDKFIKPLETSLQGNLYIWLSIPTCICIIRFYTTT